MTGTNHSEQMEWDDPSLYVDPLSLLDSKRHHQWSVRALFEAGKKLKAAHAEEVKARIAYNKAKYAAILNPDCPKVKSGETTVAYRDAWISQWIRDNYGELEWDADLAKTRLEAARDYVGVVKTQAYSMGQLGGVVRQIHGAVGLDR